MLNHIVKNEESNLESLLLRGSEALWDDLIAETGDKTLHELAMSLEKNTHELSCGDLQVVLVRVLFLDQSKIVGVECIILILNLLIGKLVVLGDSLKGLSDDIDGFFSQVGNFCLSHEAGACLIDNILECLDLSDQSIGIKLIFHGIVEVFVECLGHLVKDWCSNSACLSSLHESWEASSTGCANAIVSLVVSLSHQQLADLLNVIVAHFGDFIDEDSKHLQSNIFLLDLVSHDLHSFPTIGTCRGGHLLEDVSKLGKVLLALDSHFRVKGSHRENRWEH